MDGKIIRLPIPALSEERRRDLVKTVKTIAEETRVENVFDRVETTATLWLGVTFTCTR